jgi:hypothetical protein
MLNIHELVCIALARPDLDGEKLIEIYFEYLEDNISSIYYIHKMNNLNNEANKFEKSINYIN